MRQRDQAELAHDVLAYLVDHQEAQDSIEGIIEWWLVEQEIKHQTTAVKEVLTKLVQDNLLVERRGMDGRIHYRINRDRKEEIRQLIEQRNE